MFLKPGENPNPLCTACSGDQKNQPTLGLVMIQGRQHKGRVYRNGTILDPRDGSVYDATMEVTEDGSRRKLRSGCSGRRFFTSTLMRRIERRVLLSAQGFAGKLDEVITNEAHAHHRVDLAAP